jgi:hypothetical protein
MSNGHRNCALNICCEPRSPQHKAAVASELMVGLGWKDAQYEVAVEVADWLCEEYDLAPAGSLVQLKAEVAKLARENT